MHLNCSDKFKYNVCAQVYGDPPCATCLLNPIAVFSLDTRDLDRALAANPLKSSKGKSRRQTSEKSGKQTKEKRDPKDSALAAIGGRDTSMFLFRALGKILYCKRKFYIHSAYSNSPHAC